MSKTAIVHARLDPALKAEVEEILDEIGLSTSDAVNLFFRQVRRTGGIPFQLKRSHVPNAETIEAIKEAEEIVNGKYTRTYSDINELRRAIEGEKA